jgi:hypothetical protein
VPLALTELSDSSRAFAAIKQPLVTFANPEPGDFCHVLFENSPLSGGHLMHARPTYLRCRRWQHKWRGYLHFVFGPGALGTYPMSINASMEVTGYYNVSPTAARGFLREADGTFTTFDVAGAVWTEPEGINTAGNITGFYELVAGIREAFSGMPTGASS